MNNFPDFNIKSVSKSSEIAHVIVQSTSVSLKYSTRMLSAGCATALRECMASYLAQHVQRLRHSLGCQSDFLVICAVKLTRAGGCRSGLLCSDGQL